MRHGYRSRPRNGKKDDDANSENDFRFDSDKVAYADDNRWDDYFDGHTKGVDADIGTLATNSENYNEHEGSNQQHGGQGGQDYEEQQGEEHEQEQQPPPEYSDPDDEEEPGGRLPHYDEDEQRYDQREDEDHR